MADLVALALVYWGRTKQMTKWIEYTGSDEQIAEMKTGFIYRNKSGAQSDLILTASNFISPQHLKNYLNNVETTYILICEPHPYADLIKIWADTGCEVYIREHHNNYYDGVLESTDYHDLPPTGKPNWSIPGAEYRLTPFED